MTGKIAAIVAAVVLIASAGVASAQPKRHVPRTADQWQAPYAQAQAPYADSYYNRDYWAGVYPAGRSEPRDPLAGTVVRGRGALLNFSPTGLDEAGVSPVVACVV
jgi:hypothetical protein